MIFRPEKIEEYQIIEDLVYDTFKETTFSDGFVERELVREIRGSKYYVPELALVATNDNGDIIGHLMFSKFPLSGKNEDKVLILAPVSVDSRYQRQGIGLEMIEFGLDRAEELGYQGVIVEGNPAFYQKAGFVSFKTYGLSIAEGIPEQYVMAQELIKDGFKGIEGEINYSVFQCLT